MSYFVGVKTEFQDEACLTDALASAGIKNVQVHKTPQRLQGYGKGLAEIVIPRRAFGNSYEAGFQKQADGTYNFVAADDDSHRLDLKSLKRSYSETKTMRMAKAQGMKFVKRETGEKGNIRLIFQAAATTGR